MPTSGPPQDSVSRARPPRGPARALATHQPRPCKTRTAPGDAAGAAVGEGFLRLQLVALSVEHLQQVGGAGLVADSRQLGGPRAVDGRLLQVLVLDTGAGVAHGRAFSVSSSASSTVCWYRASSPVASASVAAEYAARTRPTSRNDQSMPSATSRVSLSRSNSALLSIACEPIRPPSVKRGNRSAVATPIRAVAACRRFWAAARRRRDDGATGRPACPRRAGPATPAMAVAG